MDPVSIVVGAIAVVCALLAMMQWRRASDLEDRVRELEAQLAQAPLPPAAEASPPEEADDEEEEDEPEPEEEPEDEPEDEDEEAEEPEEEEEEPAAAAQPEVEAPEEAEEPEEEDEEPEDEPLDEEDDDEPAPLQPVAPVPQRVAPVAAPVAKSPEPDLLRLEALKIVADSFEMCRYLDFNAIVEKPSTYRITVPITAANGKAVRYMTVGMFPCLELVKIEGSKAILHINMSKGSP